MSLAEQDGRVGAERIRLAARRVLRVQLAIAVHRDLLALIDDGHLHELVRSGGFFRPIGLLFVGATVAVASGHPDLRFDFGKDNAVEAIDGRVVDGQRRSARLREIGRRHPNDQRLVGQRCLVGHACNRNQKQQDKQGE